MPLYWFAIPLFLAATWLYRNREELEEIAVTATRRASGGAVVPFASAINRAFAGARGIRNNNPGNLRLTSIPWQGKVPVAQNTDGEFEQFVGPLWGIRAMARDLKTDFGQGQRTLRTLIMEWAPPTENATDAYVAAVSKRTGIAPDALLDLGRSLPALVDAIIVHENGANPYSAELLQEAIARA